MVVCLLVDASTLALSLVASIQYGPRRPVGRFPQRLSSSQLARLLRGAGMHKDTAMQTPVALSSPSRPAPRAPWWSTFGPGLITGASDDDPSGVGTYAQAGAQFGSGLLWVMLFTFPLMAAVQLISARVGRVTGRGLAANLARVMPRWLLMPLLVALFLTNTLNVGADLAAMGESMALVLPIRADLAALCLGLLCGGLLIAIPYSRYVSILKWLTLALLAYVATVFVVHVDWPAVAHDTVLPKVAWNKGYLQMLIAVLGTTISPYLFFWQSSQEVEEQRATPGEAPLRSAPHQAEQQLRRMKADTWAGMAVSNLIGFFIMLTAAVTLHTHGVHDIDSATKAAQALRPLAGAFAFFLFVIGIVGAGLLAVPVLAGSAAYALAEAFGWKRGLERRPAAAPAFYGTIALATLLGCAMPLLHVNAMKALVWSAVLNGVVAVPVLVAMMVAAQRQELMGEFLVRGRLKWLGWMTTGLMAAAALGLLAH
jgi:NRAMP (natural resistance-associated macrophage protein)-like metal ion transporter